MTIAQTIPRKPINASYAPPGPKYLLPTVAHDNRFNNAPAYGFGEKHKPFPDCSPGPKYGVDARLSHRGPEGAPKYSLYYRHSDPKIETTPGPGEYEPQNSIPYVKPKGPLYSMGSKNRYNFKKHAPAPNSYTLPPVTGPTITSDKRQAPVSTLKSRHEQIDYVKAPGPGRYLTPQIDDYKFQSPRFSFGSKFQLVADKTVVPGPGTHCPEKVSVHMKKSANYSFGSKHSEYTIPMISPMDVE